MAEDEVTVDLGPDEGDGASLPGGNGPGNPPERIGQYHIRSLIASGGMGSVYRAVQARPRRTVALKVLRPGVASRSALRRFEYEAQLLARLRHPNIAEVYEAGTHDDAAGGVPYFVMEFIAGARPITEYAAAKRLTVRQKLELFVTVCEAVQHGHSRGVIHRDLKPANIQVDSVGRVKVIDFGVARATDSDLAMTTLQTGVGQLVGTVQYMSPEQIDADPDDLDTRSDVYSLGVVLYELLTGRPPYDVRRANLFEATRIIREGEAARPGTIDAALRGDIETIVLKALEKDRDRRYASAQGLADDIRRWLNGQAIAARPPTVGYQLRVFARRHKPLLGGVGAGFAALLAGLVASLVLYAQAERRGLEARAEADKANRAVAMLTELIDTANPDTARGAAYTVRQMLDEYSAALGDRLVGQPEVEAHIRTTIGLAYWRLRQTDQAEPHLRRAYELWRELYGEDDPRATASLLNLAWNTVQSGEPERGRPLAERALESYRLRGDVRGMAASERAIAMSYMRVGGGYGAAERHFREAVRLARLAAAGADEPELANILHDAAASLNNLGRHAEAEALAREAVAMHRRVHGSAHPETMWGLNILGDVLSRLGGYEEAEAAFREAYETRLRLFGDAHYDTQRAGLSLASTLLRLGRGDEAVSLATALEGGDDAYAWVVKGDILARAGRWDAAEDAFGRARRAGGGEPSARARQALAVLGSGDRPRFERLAAEALAPHHVTADHGSPVWLVMSGIAAQGLDEQRLTGLRALTDRLVSDAAQLDPPIAGPILARALVAYRESDDAAALGLLGTLPRDADPAWRAAAELVRAMASRRVGDGEAADAALVGADDLLGRLAAPGDPGFGEAWHAWVLAQALRREATGG